MQGWEGKLLSQAGQEVLMKAVVQALPTYTMSCFKLPTGLCHDIEALIRNFFWGQNLVDEQRLKVEELEKEVDSQIVLISDGAEEKREVIRQLCFSLEHYRSWYQELRKAFIVHKQHAVLAS